MIASLVHVFPEAQKVVDEHATEDGKALLAEIEGMSTGGAIRRFRNVDIADYVDVGFKELFALPELRHVLEVTRLGQNAPSVGQNVLRPHGRCCEAAGRRTSRGRTESQEHP